MAGSRKVDISELVTNEAGRATLNWSSETDDERAARIRVEEGDAGARRWRANVTHVSMIVALFSVGAICLVGAFVAEVAETRQFAAAVVSAIVAGAVGHLTGKASR